MKQVSMPIKTDSQVNIIVSDDLSLSGKNQLLMTALVKESDSLKFSEDQGKVEIRATSDLSLQLPALQPVTVEKAGGDAHVSGLIQRVIIGKVGGDLALVDLAGASVEMVGGDISLQRTTGAVEIARVGGDLVGSAVESVLSSAVGGDIYLRDVKGSLNLVAGGDVVLQLASANPAMVTITAGGDVKIRVHAACNAQLELYTEGGSIRLNACGQQGEWDQEQVVIPFGEGGNVVSIKAEGDILIIDHDDLDGVFQSRWDEMFENWEGFGSDLEKRVRESVAATSERIKWATLGTAAAGEKVRLKLEQAMRKLDERGKRLRERGITIDLPEKPGVCGDINATGFRRGENDKVVGFTFPGENASTPTPTSKATDEERVMVLKMLQEKKITLEEAEKILSALEK